MNPDFDTLINRNGTNSVKYDFAREKGKPQGLLPMWVADMDFTAPPEVLADIQQAVSHGIFGYSEPKEDYYNAVIEWFSTRFNFQVKQHEIVKSPGLVYGLAQAVRAFTAPNDAVMIQTPVYYPFYSVITDNNRLVIKNPLVYQNGRYGIDFEDFERKIANESVKLFILCSPHNPVGRVWTREELERMNDICVKYGVIVVSDEIHCDFVWNGHTHTCFGTINENAVIATAPSKTFNLAGLQVSNIFVKNEDLRNKLQAEIGRSGYHQLNTLGIIACQSAYTKGGAWLDELKAYLTENIRLVQEFLEKRLPKIKLVEPQAMYLLWLDFSEYGLTQTELDRRIEKAKLWLNGGTMFGAEGKGFQRINIACPKSVVLEALERLEKKFTYES
ncbi:MAG: pyridoxal phosphate-dependent aminotransferase [Prevotellaceae bacterium]|jgi:cystathionine beta-lyase|nr:pyridoxal phosphate-dependent aminotransferase [Prevotellaceae bacterium]